MTLEQRNVWRKLLLEDGASGMATIEVLLIIAVLIALVILFKDTILGFVTEILVTVFFSNDTEIEMSAPRTDILPACRKRNSGSGFASLRPTSDSLVSLSSTARRMSQAGPPRRRAPAILLPGTLF